MPLSDLRDIVTHAGLVGVLSLYALQYNGENSMLGRLALKDLGIRSAGNYVA